VVVGLVDQLLGVHSTRADPFLYHIDAQSWPFVVRNSLAKVNRNQVIIFD
jgi:hypothetical protein